VTFTKKLLLVLVLQPVLILGALYTILDSAIKKESYQNLTHQIQETEKIVQSNLNQIRHNLKFALKLTISDFAFKQAFAQQDKDTLVTISENYKNRIQVQVFELLDRDGKKLLGTDDQKDKKIEEKILHLSDEEGAADYFEIHNGRVFLYVISPIKAPILMGYTKIGVEIDQLFLSPIATSSRTNLTLVLSDGHSLSTLEYFKSLPLITNSSLKDDFIQFSTDKDLQIGKKFDLFTDSSGITSILLTKSQNELLGSYNKLRDILGTLFSLSLIFATIIAIFWGKGMSRRLLKLTHEVTKISGDHLHFSLEDKKKDEIGSLTRSFRKMTEQLSDYIKKNNDALITIEEQNAALSTQVEEDAISLRIVNMSMNTRNLTQFVDSAINELVCMKGFHQCNLMLQNEGENNFEIISDRVYNPKEEKSNKVSTKINKINRSDLLIAVKCLKERKPTALPLEEVKDMIEHNASSLLVGSYLCIPLIANETEIGVLNFITEQSPQYWLSGKKLVFLQLIAGEISLALSNLFLHHKATTDGLTKLPNRSYFVSLLEHEVSRAIRAKKPLSLIYLDVDFFKKVNDEHGHDTGDQVLIGMGEILSNMCRDTDIAARIGGEEFVFLLPYTSKEGAQQVAEKLRKKVQEASFVIGNKTLSITSSFGIATFPEDADTQETLMKNADTALYKAKHNGRNRVEVF